MLQESSFMKDEGAAPLLSQNHKYLHNNKDIAWQKTRIWFNLLLNAEEKEHDNEQWTIVSNINTVTINTDNDTANEITNKQLNNYGLKIVEKPGRLIVADAARNFTTKSKQVLMITMLEAIKTAFNDYQQTMSYVTGILLLFYPPKIAFKMVFMLGRNPKYNMCGYWRGYAVQQSIDMHVIYKILKKINPDLYNHLKSNNALCGWYQPWLGGLAVQVMPIKHLIDLWTGFFQNGFRYLFTFILSYLQILSPLLLSIDRVERLNQTLRGNRIMKFWKCCLDEKHHQNQMSVDEKVDVFFMKVFENMDIIGKQCNIDTIDFVREREFVFSNELSQSELSGAIGMFEHKFEIEDEEDLSDDIEEADDCQACDDAFADMFCIDCQIFLCEQCHKKSSGDHLLSHSIAYH